MEGNSLLLLLLKLVKLFVWGRPVASGGGCVFLFLFALDRFSGSESGGPNGLQVFWSVTCCYCCYCCDVRTQIKWAQLNSPWPNVAGAAWWIRRARRLQKTTTTTTRTGRNSPSERSTLPLYRLELWPQKSAIFFNVFFSLLLKNCNSHLINFIGKKTTIVTVS